MLHYLLKDPRNDSSQLIPPVFHETNTQGVGLMYRIINSKKLFIALGDHDYGGESCSIKFDITDSFYPDNAGDFVVHFIKGLVRTDGESFDVTIGMDISDLSSMVMGAVSFKKLYQYNRVQISDIAYVEKLARLFRGEEPPVCLTFF
jgi:predicted acetyltransferase